MFTPPQPPDTAPARTTAGHDAHPHAVGVRGFLSHALRRRPGTARPCSPPTGRIALALISLLGLLGALLAATGSGRALEQVSGHDGAIWVLDRADHRVLRVDVLEAVITDALALEHGQEVLQDGGSVLVRTLGGLRRADPAAIRLGPAVLLPPDAVVRSGGDRIAIAGADGTLWVLDADQAAGFDPARSLPVLTGSGQPLPVALTAAGDVLVLQRDRLLRFPRAERTEDSRQRASELLPGPAPGEGVQLSAVGERAVVLDAERGRLLVEGRADAIDLRKLGIAPGAQVRLQQPSTAASPAADHVVLATAQALLRIPLDGGSVQSIAPHQTGAPLDPLQTGGCAIGAWTGSDTLVVACAQGPERVLSIPDVPAGADLVLLHVRGMTALTDRGTGATWIITLPEDASDVGRHGPAGQDREAAIRPVTGEGAEG